MLEIIQPGSPTLEAWGFGHPTMSPWVPIHPTLDLLRDFHSPQSIRIAWVVVLDSWEDGVIILGSYSLGDPMLRNLETWAMEGRLKIDSCSPWVEKERDSISTSMMRMSRAMRRSFEWSIDSTHPILTCFFQGVLQVQFNSSISPSLRQWIDALKQLLKRNTHEMTNIEVAFHHLTLRVVMISYNCLGISNSRGEAL